MKPIFISILSLLLLSISAQRGKNGDVTINSNSIVNEYTVLTSNASQGQSSISVSNSNLNTNGRFVGNLEPGDLIFIHQAQGASLSTTQTKSDWGSISAYNDCGNYEFCQVSSIPDGTTINISCGLKNNYTSAGHVQIIRVPRFNTLTINATITCDPWDGEKGGIVIIESLSDMTINSSGIINVDGSGFRGGIEDYASSGIGTWALAMTNPDGGGVKGESIYGYDNDYNALGGKYGYGAPANGGGGGDNHNAGGGGGGNGSQVGNWNEGIGVPDPSYNIAWALETPSISGAVTSGGGKGGYTFAGNGGNPLTSGPNNYGVWGGDGRRPVGGLGGRPLDYSLDKIYFGGGGGSGDINDLETLGGHGGNAGGIVFLRCFASINGTGTIDANGDDGVDAYTVSPPNFDYAGNDGAGGGGAGGTVILEAANSISSLTINSNGGNGGDQILSPGNFYFGSLNESEGPGGGGSGGFIRTSHTGVNVNINGGVNGVTNSNGMNQFPPNGATSGGDGDHEISSPLFSIIAENDTICAGNSTTLSASIIGSLPSGAGILWYDAPINGNFVGAGLNFTTGNISNDTTFYVGVCPGNYTVPVSVIMGSSFSFSTSNIQITDEHCGQSDGGITGINITGGALPLQYEWNNVVSANQDLENVSAGTYTLIVTDNNGCAGTIGSFIVGNDAGPIVDTSQIIIENDQCSQSLGSISNIQVSGNSPFLYSWNGSSNPSIDLNNLSSGLYDLEVTDSFGCTTLIEDIDINDTQGPTIDTTAIIIEDDHCSQSVGEIQGIQLIGNAPYTILWNNIVSTSVDTTGLSGGIYNLSVTDNFGCTSELNNLVIADVSGPVIDIANIQITPETCLNMDGSIQNVVVTGSDPFTYLWNGSNSNLDLTNISSGFYDLTVQDAFGCQSVENNIFVPENGFPNATLDISPNPAFIGDSVFYSNNTLGSIVSSTIILSDGSIVTNSDTSEIFTQDGIYSICLNVENSFGCRDSVCNEVIINPIFEDFIVPNIFTPNKDGNNDYFSIEGLNDNYNIYLFNRWGQVVFSESPYQNMWDGTGSNGEILSEGTYYYILEIIDESLGGETISGFILLQK